MTEQPSSALWRFVKDDDPSALTLIVDTPKGAHLRRIPPALPLPSHVDHGTGAEAAVHTAAATWGMPDFVFQQAEHAAKGSGQRELGDCLLLAGGRGAAVQVKARTIPPKPATQEARWIQKVAAKAMSQAKGTIRQLSMVPADMVNGRGRFLSVDANAYEWIAVFLLDHPHVPDATVVTWPPVGLPAIALTRRDWDFLFDQLRSTTAVLDYLFRAAADPVIPLGQEPLRYYEFAAADAEASPAEVDTGLVGPGGTLFSAPLLPQVPAARALRQAAPVLELPEDDTIEFTQLATRMETEATNGSPDPGRLQRWGASIIGILNSPVISGALGSVLATYTGTVLPGLPAG
ncbi:hypothetical protein [Streptomyces sp. TLI_185]|uniref:hypothetical protein n=1 Tax=Streptomyces sp. TLI_185 TaxID=2485151 RepID=UPI000F501E6B|nr:hypothetical protein [Streptomyces sp. TLI_185]RPF39314.1 hypothetical protein EDD92_9556 [Streptomyces sp. TLI_185]